MRPINPTVRRKTSSLLAIYNATPLIGILQSAQPPFRALRVAVVLLQFLGKRFLIGGYNMNRKHLHIAVTAGLMAALSLGAAAVPAFAEEAVPSAVEETTGEGTDYNASAMTTEAQDSVSRSSSIPGLPDHADPGDIVYRIQPSMIYEAVADEDGVTHYSINAVEGYLEFPTLRVFKYEWHQWADEQGNPTGEGDWVVQNAYGTECETTWIVSGYDGDFPDLQAGTYTAVGTTVSDEEEFSGKTLEVTVNIVEAD